MKGNWSPGPWKVTGMFGVQAEDDLLCITSSGDEHLADNLRLIAASPDLYTTLERMREVLDGCRKDTVASPMEGYFAEMVAECDKALAKARGETA